jgi:MFS family permease
LLFYPDFATLTEVTKPRKLQGHSVKQGYKEIPPSDKQLSSITPTAGMHAGRTLNQALRVRDFRLLLAGSFLSMFGRQMLSVAIGWELYLRTSSALVLGGIGLAQVLPIIVLFLPSGYIADRYSRRYVVIGSQVVLALASLYLAFLSYQHGSLWLIYACLAIMGGAQSFNGPASSALVAQVVPESAYENAMTWRSSVTQLSAVLGPTTGGLLIGILQSATFVYVLCAITSIIFIALLVPMHVNPQKKLASTKRTLASLVEGMRFLGKAQVLLAAITLDLFAVLLGGATTLLPIYAQNILHVGPIGLGWMQAASSIGAICTALILASRPPFKHAGYTLLLAVTGFGVATIIFGLSRSFWLSLLMLFLLGACDNISVVIRSTLLLVRTPDEMRGRVSAVSSLFISSSNQLGGFESGLVAQLIGPVLSVVTGGIGTILVVLLIAFLWPEMRHLGTLREEKQAQSS